ncbi:GNAT family N-acetyltransferase [Streptomyces sp. NPDC057445]|uniref:GNAT family N-acetyltransferase n=1 Tax=Streptomyces sp. NPDC057445 TaxID=3346136 RepID=UPI00368EB660
MDILIRRAETREYEALGELTALTYLRDGLLEFGEADPYLEVLRDVATRAGQAEVLVAVDEAGQVLGGVTFAPGGTPWADIARTDETEFRMLAVAAPARGRGAGEALVRACIERARSTEGCLRLLLSTTSAMRAAHRIYERLGFVRTPERDWEPIPGLGLLTYGLEL